MKRLALTATIATALAAGACTYERGAYFATASRWDTRDADDRRVVEREPRDLQKIASPFNEGAVPATAGGPGVDENAPLLPQQESPVTEADIADEGADVVIQLEPEEQETTAAASEAPIFDDTDADDAPLVQRAEPERRALADPALQEIAREETPTEPLIADGFLRDDACPMGIDGARVSLVEAAEGPTLVFVSDDDEHIVDLQNRVMAMALTKDDERVEEAVQVEADVGTSAAFDEDLSPRVQPPQDTEMEEGAPSDMPFNLPSELTAAEQERANEPDVVDRFAPLPEAEVTVELTDEGAHVLFRPLAAGQRAALTQQLATRAEALEQGDCPAGTMSMIVRSDDAG